MSDELRFNFGAVSPSWRNDLRKAELMLARANARVERTGADLDVSDEELAEMWEKLDAAQSHRDNLMAQAVESVPGDWLIDAAPDAVDWSKPGAMDYLRVDRIQSLVAALTEAVQNPAGKSNSRM